MATVAELQKDLNDALSLLEQYAYLFRKLNAPSVLEASGKLGGDAESFLNDVSRSFKARARIDDRVLETRNK